MWDENFLNNHQLNMILAMSAVTLGITFSKLCKQYFNQKKRVTKSNSNSIMNSKLNNEIPRYLHSEISNKEPEWYRNYKENQEKREFGKQRFPRDQILQNINKSTLKKENLIAELPEWYKDYLLDIEQPYYIGKVLWRPKYKICNNCKHHHCEHNVLPFAKSMECRYCISFSCVHYDRTMEHHKQYYNEESTYEGYQVDDQDGDLVRL